jgi:hypothetical protein
MTASATVRQRTPHGQALQRLVARHPVATFLLLVFSVSVAVAQVPVLTRHDILPFDLALYDSLGPVLGVALPAFVVWRSGRREGVRELASRCLRWRVGLRWFAFLASRQGSAVRRRRVRTAAFVVLADRWTLLFTAVLPQLVLLIVCCIVAGGRLHGVPSGRWQDFGR